MLQQIFAPSAADKKMTAAYDHTNPNPDPAPNPSPPSPPKPKPNPSRSLSPSPSPSPSPSRRPSPHQVGFAYRASLRALSDTMAATNQHYIRCLKPNMQKTPMLFHGDVRLLGLGLGSGLGLVIGLGLGLRLRLKMA